ncbi:MAG: GNAT family N-acetyltransferase, partial [Candidatus Omnitrophica bacterium]|nr:GNAT family N-acetyltransferase [Candidatus Omnitrophota bacterium]
GLFEPQAVFLATDDEGAAIGMAEVSIRPIAEGCRTNRVGYLEGWYVAPDHRRAGVGRLLVEAAETWSRAQGCTEFASDTESDNTPSRLAHRALGFEEVGVVRCFRKGL